MNVLTRLITIKDVWSCDTFCCLTNRKYDSDRMHFLGSSVSIPRQLSPLNSLGSKFCETEYLNRVGWVTDDSGTYPIDHVGNNRVERTR